MQIKLEVICKYLVSGMRKICLHMLDPLSTTKYYFNFVFSGGSKTHYTLFKKKIIITHKLYHSKENLNTELCKKIMFV